MANILDMFNLDEIKELEKQFNEEFGSPEEKVNEYDEYHEETHTETLADVVEDMLAAYMEECIDHFLAARSRSMDDDGRYFYNDEELEAFKKGYTLAGGDLDILHIGSVYYDNGDWLCYEVCRKRYYELQTYYARKQKKANSERIFFS